MTTTDPTSRLPHVRVTKWEYRVEDAKTAAGEENFNRLGDEGWEFVEVLSMKTELGFHTTYFFKRPKEWGWEHAGSTRRLNAKGREPLGAIPALATELRGAVRVDDREHARH